MIALVLFSLGATLCGWRWFLSVMDWTADRNKELCDDEWANAQIHWPAGGMCVVFGVLAYLSSFWAYPGCC